MMHPNLCPWESIEIRKLKIKLANLSCDCLTNEENKSSISSYSDDARSRNKEVQVELISKINTNYIDQFSQADQQMIHNDNQSVLERITKDVLCPRCFVTMSLLRGGSIKILKDQDTEVRPDIFTTEQYVDGHISETEGATSPAKLEPRLSNLAFCDYLTESSATSVNMNDHENRVKFSNKVIYVDPQDINSSSACRCLEDYMESIRPPLGVDLV